MAKFARSKAARDASCSKRSISSAWCVGDYQRIHDETSAACGVAQKMNSLLLWGFRATPQAAKATPQAAKKRGRFLRFMA
jgi:hypothetical protein